MSEIEFRVEKPHCEYCKSKITPVKGMQLVVRYVQGKVTLFCNSTCARNYRFITYFYK